MWQAVAAGRGRVRRWQWSANQLITSGPSGQLSAIRSRSSTDGPEAAARHRRTRRTGLDVREVHRAGDGAEHGDRGHLRHRPGEGRRGRVRVPRSAVLRRLRRDAGERRRGRRRHLRSALPAPRDGHPSPRARHSRARREAGRRLHQTGQGADGVRGHQTGPDLRHHVQPAQQPALPQDQGDRRQRTRSARSGERTGSSPPGGARRATTTRAPGARRGAARAAASWSTRPRTSSTSGSGSAACPSPSTPRSATGSAATSRSKTR